MTQHVIVRHSLLGYRLQTNGICKLFLIVVWNPSLKTYMLNFIPLNSDTVRSKRQKRFRQTGRPMRHYPTEYPLLVGTRSASHLLLLVFRISNSRRIVRRYSIYVLFEVQLGRILCGVRFVRIWIEDIVLWMSMGVCEQHADPSYPAFRHFLSFFISSLF